ncbi:type 4a pilus biogenesis protein PilO [Candidatus Microgenomates bacterium]|nr:type 4a pilus biogenesis protein PilO [Candidatus Microgenomates bacterium]
MALNISIPRDLLARRYSRYYIYLEPVVSDPLIRGYFSFVASLFLIAFLLIFALSPTINTMLTLQKKIGQQKEILAALDQKRQALIVAQQNYAQIENSLPLLLTALPTNPAPQTILSGVASVASASGVVVSGLHFADIPLSADQFSDQRTSVDFTFVISGLPDQTRDFLKKLENLPRQIRVVTVSIGRATGQSGDLVNVMANGFYLKDFGI